jgi:hypothetical protein
VSPISTAARNWLVQSDYYAGPDRNRERYAKQDRFPAPIQGGYVSGFPRFLRMESQASLSAPTRRSAAGPKPWPHRAEQLHATASR